MNTKVRFRVRYGLQSSSFISCKKATILPLQRQMVLSRWTGALSNKGGGGRYLQGRDSIDASGNVVTDPNTVIHKSGIMDSLNASAIHYGIMIQWGLFNDNHKQIFNVRGEKNGFERLCRDLKSVVHGQ